MSHLLNKSLFNKDAADLLLKSNYYAPSIHCNYYRCVQLMLHIIYNKLKIDKQVFDNTNKQNGKTHKHAADTISYELIKKDRDAYKDFQKLIPEIKKLRNKSDYFDVEITQPDSYNAKNYADSIVNILTKAF